MFGDSLSSVEDPPRIRSSLKRCPLTSPCCLHMHLGQVTRRYHKSHKDCGTSSLPAVPETGGRVPECKLSNLGAFSLQASNDGLSEAELECGDFLLHLCRHPKGSILTSTPERSSESLLLTNQEKCDLVDPKLPIRKIQRFAEQKKEGTEVYTTPSVLITHTTPTQFARSRPHLPMPTFTPTLNSHA